MIQRSRVLTGKLAKTHCKRLRLTRSLRTEQLESRSMMIADSVGVVRGADLWLLNTDDSAAHEVDVNYGLEGDKYVAGKWYAGSAGDMPGVVRRGPEGLLHWYLDTNGDPDHELEFTFGLPGDIPVAGDWNADGIDDVGVVRRQPDGLLHWYLNLDNTPVHELEYSFGVPGDIPVVGDWNGDGIDDVGVARGNGAGLFDWFLNTDNDVYADEPVFSYGFKTDTPITGDWDNDGKDNVGAIRVEADGLLHWYLDTDRDSTHEIEKVFGRPSDKPVVGNWVLPEIAVDQVFSNQPTTPISFGIVRETGGAAPTRSIVIRNTGTSTLHMSPHSLSDGFSIVQWQTSQLAPGQSTTVVVRMDTDVAGNKKGTFSIATNDGNEDPYVIYLAGRVGLPEITVYDGSNGIGYTDGQSTVTFPTTLVGQNSVQRSFIIRNDGNAPLGISRIALPTGFKLLLDAPKVIHPGQVATFTVGVNQSVAAVRSGNLVIINDDTNEARFNIALSATIVKPSPVAKLYGAEANVSNFGNARYLGTQPSRTYIIQNMGNATLNLGDIFFPNGFELTSRGSRYLAPGASSSFTIRLKTSAIGTFAGNVVISTNDPRQSNLTFGIAGQCTLSASTPNPQPPAVPPSTPEAHLTSSTGEVISTTGSTIALNSATRPSQVVDIANAGSAILRLSDLSLPPGFAIENFPTSGLRPHETVSVIIRLSGDIGTFSGNLTFTTNDSDEGLYKIGLSGRQFPPVEILPGTPSRPRNGIFEIYDTGVTKVEIHRAYGRVPGNTFYVVDIYKGDTIASKAFIDASLTKLRLFIPNLSEVVNDTGVLVELNSL